jgi:hypothetical protein
MESEVTGDRLNPLKVATGPGRALPDGSGMVARLCSGENCGITPKRTSIADAASSGPPTTVVALVWGAGTIAGIAVPWFSLLLVLCGLALISGELFRPQRA